jgi:hypothetical protein
VSSAESRRIGRGEALDDVELVGGERQAEVTSFGGGNTEEVSVRKSAEDEDALRDGLAPAVLDGVAGASCASTEAIATSIFWCSAGLMSVNFWPACAFLRAFATCVAAIWQRRASGGRS